MNFWSLGTEQTLKNLSLNKQTGLTKQQVEQRLQEYGPNAFEEQKSESIFSMVLRQFKDVSNLILLLAMGLSFTISLREQSGFLEPIVILIIIAINMVLAVTQERGAEKALDALASLHAPRCIVIRDGQQMEIETASVVVGDLIVLKTGSLVPADARLIESTSLFCDESSLTGESEPAEKDARVTCKQDAALGDRINMVFSGCLVTAGNALAVVVATGMKTEMGRIAGYLNDTQKMQTPLQQRLVRVVRMISVVASVSAVILLISGLQQGEDLWAMMLAAVSLAVAAVPETLQLIVTLTLTHGITLMAKKHALIRQLPAVETLGSTSVICSDKTGTLTQNRMAIRRMWMPGCEPCMVEGAHSLEDSVSYTQFLQHLALASNASVETDENGKQIILGDATETAIVRLLREGGMTRTDLLHDMPRVAEIPFSSDRKMMTSVHKLPRGGYIVLVKGAFDHLPIASPKNDAEQLALEERQRMHDSFAKDALRVIALASRFVAELPDEHKLETLEQNLNFEGIIGLIDPPRPEVKEAIDLASRAGVRTVMITGDHAVTAGAIAQQLGLVSDPSSVVTGNQLSAMSDDELIENIRRYSVYARVSPEDKIRIVEAWQEQGEVVSMTGDGVNDAPALKAADVGVAMGQTGTEVAKKAADMVLTDDNFATIVTAVREGRNVFSNIRRTIYFLITCNLAEILIMLFIQLAGWGTALTPVMLLLVNVLGDGIPGLHLPRDRSDERIMARKPIGRTESFFSEGIVRATIQQTLITSVVGVLGFWWGKYVGFPGMLTSHEAGQTACFLIVFLTSVLHIFTVRSRTSIFKRSVLDNIPLLMSCIAVFAGFSALVLIPAFGAIFEISALNLYGWLIAVGLSVVPTIFAEIFKFWDNHQKMWVKRLRLVHRRSHDR